MELNKLNENDDIESLAEFESRFLDTAWTQNQIFESLRNECFCYYYTAVDSKIVGIISYYRQFDEIEIINIAVDKDFRRQGIAKSMIGFVINENQGLSKLKLEYRRSNKAAEAFYNSLGFVKVGEREKIYANDTVILADLII